MDNRECYEMKLAELDAIDVKDLTLPHNIPLDTYIQEAYNLYRWAGPDIDQLTEAGLSRELLEDIPVRAGALIHAESQWSGTRLGGKEANKKWNQEAPEAYQLRDSLQKSFRFAFRQHQNLLDMLKTMGSGGHATMLQELNNLAVTGKKYQDLLEPINFDLSLLDRARAQVDRLSELLAKTNRARMQYDILKLKRDQAYTLLKQAVDDVYRCGKYVFSQNHPRFRGYSSQFLRQKRQRIRNKSK